MAESTGKFPPTPTLHKAAKQPIAAKLGEPAAMRPKTEVMPIVRLNAHRRPKMSHPKPQNIAPTSSPIFCDNERSGGFEGENSLVIAGRIRDVITGQRLSLAQPNPSQRISLLYGSGKGWIQSNASFLLPRNIRTSDDDE